jgi:cellulose biosynthesis protein BcsQ
MIYAIANQKGGGGKTTTASALGAAVAERGLHVLLVNLDPQAGLTMSFGIDPDSGYDVILLDCPPTLGLLTTKDWSINYCRILRDGAVVPFG